MKSLYAILRKVLRAAILLGALALIFPRLITALHAHRRLFTVESVSARPVAIVFGAGLWWDGRPTLVLRDRVAAAVELYYAQKVDWLLMSGSHSGSYNEPDAMRTYAISLGVPAEAIMVDDGGDRTYDTCYRAMMTYGIKSAILVTQPFHLPRALYTCDQLGIDAIGVPADLHSYKYASIIYWNLRELPATLSALLDIHFLHPKLLAPDPNPTPSLRME